MPPMPGQLSTILNRRCNDLLFKWEPEDEDEEDGRPRDRVRRRARASRATWTARGPS
jgi:hypothetical protein